MQIDRYGRGERHAGIQDPGALSNCDPFLGDAVYVEPIYDPFWYCSEPPNWENVACVPADVRTQVARSVGMIVSIHGDHVSTCSVTLVDADKVVTAGHCITTAEAETASVVFDYQTDCAGNRPPGYAARFHKVSAVLQRRWDGTHDYALLQLATAPAGIPALQMRHDVP
ncbi:trypsin-like serine protease, partial [Arthrospira platensis SPKY1]|nr:trypsin-like serine protease [Arthrospira platensis SPKY1]